MNKKSVSKIMAYVVIVCGLMLVTLLALSSPPGDYKYMLSWKFLTGLFFVLFGVFTLKVRK